MKRTIAEVARKIVQRKNVRVTIEEFNQFKESRMNKLSVTEFSMLPLQSGLIIQTPEGEGTYEGITSSGIVKVFINGGISEYSWSEVTPNITVKHIQLMDDFIKKMRLQNLESMTEKRTAEEMYSNVVGRPGIHKDLPLQLKLTTTE